MRFLILISIGFLICTQAHAATVLKCVDAAGKTIFVQDHCPDTHKIESVSAYENQRPSGDGAAVKMAKPVTVVRPPTARRTYNHCGNLTQVDIAYANGRGEIILGMTRDDVTKSWGLPAQVNSTASGQQWVYPLDEYRNRYLYVDQAGCFTYWN